MTPVLLLSALSLAATLSFAGRAQAAIGECVPSVYVDRGDRMDFVVSKCGNPSSYRVLRGAPGRPEQVIWVYKREGSFPRILRFLGGYLQSVTMGSGF